MKKLLVFLLFLIIAPILGGIYGIIHDQISFTISKEYYTKLKFDQFGLAHWGMGYNAGTADEPEVLLNDPRFGAAIVGLLATWWMGLLIGLLLGLIGFFHKDWKTMFSTTLKAASLNIAIALLFGLLGIGVGFFLDPAQFHLPAHLVLPKRFIIVGTMHNFSYLGGIVGLIIACFYSIRKIKETSNNDR